MTEKDLRLKCVEAIETLCNKIPERSVGSEGNRQATYFVEKEFAASDWSTEMPSFEAMDWEGKDAILTCGKETINLLVSPYSNGFSGEAELVAASTIEELEDLRATGRIIFLSGEIAAEQLMPKNFVFYNPEHHRHIISLLETSGAAAIISATGRNSALAGGVYPFPLIEDGDFDIPSAYTTDIEGEKIKLLEGKKVFLVSHSRRIPGRGFNVIARKGNSDGPRVIVTAHVDAKKGTSGAIDNATGVTVLLLLAELLKDYNGSKLIELVAFNGEDYYAVPGQMNYIASNQGQFDKMMLNINIDGAGYKTGSSSFSLFNLPAEINTITNDIIKRFPGIQEGAQWPQGDHSIFLQFGVPAIAVSSKWFIDNMDTQDVTHTPKDNSGIVDHDKLTEIAIALDQLIRRL